MASSCSVLTARLQSHPLKTYHTLEIQSRELGSYAFTHFLDKEGHMATPLKMQCWQAEAAAPLGAQDRTRS